MKKKPTPENIIKAQVKDYLDLMGWFNFHVMQGLGSYPGAADRIAVKDGIVLFIECKSPTGKMSDSQIEFRSDLVDHKGIYLLVDNFDAFMAFLKCLK